MKKDFKETEQNLSLSKEAQEKLVDIISNPPKPTKNLKKLMNLPSFNEH